MDKFTHSYQEDDSHTFLILIEKGTEYVEFLWDRVKGIRENVGNMTVGNLESFKKYCEDVVVKEIRNKKK